MLDAHWPRRSYAMHTHLCHFVVSLDTCKAFEIILSFFYPLFIENKEQIDVRERVSTKWNAPFVRFSGLSHTK